MKPIAHHIRISLRNGAVIARTAQQRLLVAHSVLGRSPDFGLLCFALPDTHLHMEAMNDELACGELARRVEISITRSLKLPVGFAPPYLKPIYDQDHLRKTFFYDLNQLRNHNVLHTDPLGLATNIPDLLGMRLLGRNTRAQMEAWLPRVQDSALLACLGIGALPEGDLPLDLLAEAAAAAVGVPALVGRSEPVRQARRAAVAVADGALPWTALARQLGACVSMVRKLRRQPADPDLVKATRLQLLLRQARATSA